MKDVYIAEKEHKPHVPGEIEEEEMGSLSAFAVHPSGLIFESQEPGEKIELFLRQHPIVNVPWMATSVMLIAAPLVLRYFPLLEFLPPRFKLVSVVIWYLVVSAYVFESFLSWFFNIYIVTNKRVIDVDFYNLVYKEITDATLDKIQDVTMLPVGVASAIFDFGDVIIQTAGAKVNIEFHSVPNPDRIVKILRDLRVPMAKEK